jgi:hypothetical protein
MEGDEMTGEEQAAAIVEFAVAKLEAGPDDVVLARPPEEWPPAMCAEMQEILDLVREYRGIPFDVLVVPPGFDFTVVKRAEAPDRVP